MEPDTRVETTESDWLYHPQFGWCRKPETVVTDLDRHDFDIYQQCQTVATITTAITGRAASRQVSSVLLNGELNVVIVTN